MRLNCVHYSTHIVPSIYGYSYQPVIKVLTLYHLIVMAFECLVTSSHFIEYVQFMFNDHQIMMENQLVNS